MTSPCRHVRVFVLRRSVVVVVVVVGARRGEKVSSGTLLLGVVGHCLLA